MLTRLRRLALRRGLFGGSRQWTIVWAVLIGTRLLRRLARPKPEILLCEELQPGQTLLVSAVDRQPRILGEG